MNKATSELHVPDEFRAWVQSLPPAARQKLSIHELRQIWEPMRQHVEVLSDDAET